MNENPPVLLIGAGPAGVSAALWLANFEIPFRWVDARGRVGGMLHRVNNRIENYPGGDYPDGRALANAMENQLRNRDLSPQKATLQSISQKPDSQKSRSQKPASLQALLADDTSIFADRLILATGSTYRTLDVPGEKKGLGKWVSQSATADATRFQGRSVAVIGGGDAGFENALILAESNCTVTLLLRSKTFRARPAFIRAVRAHPKITIAPIPTTVLEISPAPSGCRILLDQNGRKQTMNAAAIFIRIGVDPQIPGGLESLQKNDTGFLRVDQNFRTSCPKIFAIGDVASVPLRSAAAAVGSGAIAARACAIDLNYL